MTRNISEIEADIERAKEELENVKGTSAEVYTRIVGYYRSVRNWNKGKREEYKERKLFVPSKKETEARLAATEALEGSCACGNRAAQLQAHATALGAFSSAKESPVHTELFTRKSCPNCPPVKEYVEGHFEDVHVIDVDSDEGFNRAQECGVLSTPTVIFYADDGAEVARAHNLNEIKTAEAAIISKAALPA